MFVFVYLFLGDRTLSSFFWGIEEDEDEEEGKSKDNVFFMFCIFNGSTLCFSGSSCFSGSGSFLGVNTSLSATLYDVMGIGEGVLGGINSDICFVISFSDTKDFSDTNDFSIVNTSFSFCVFIFEICGL